MCLCPLVALLVVYVWPHLSHVMRKPALCHMRTTHPRSLISAFVVRCLDCIIPILAKSTIFRTLVSLCRRAGRFESYQVANHEDMVSRDEAHFMFSCFSTLPLGASGVMRYLIVALPRDFVIVFLFEPRHDKTNKMAVRMKKAWVLSYPLSTNEDSDHTGRMSRLIWVFAGSTLILLVLSCRGSFLVVLWDQGCSFNSIYELQDFRSLTYSSCF